MEFGAIEREIFIDASPEIVFDVVSQPEHLQEWWPDQARFEPVAGASGELVFGDRDAGGKVVAFTVVEARPPTTFAFRWAYPSGSVASPGNSLLVTFDLTPAGGGTRLRMTETGFREQGWPVAVVQEQYQDHVNGWAHFLPRLDTYVATLSRWP